MSDGPSSRPLQRWRQRGGGFLARSFSSAREASSPNGQLAQVEVQEDLQRFATSFIERITQVTDAWTQDRRSPLHELALRRALYCSSAALDIAAGSDPEVSLLDMVVFVTLCRDACASQWTHVAGDEAEGLLDVLNTASQEIWALVRKLLDPQQEEQLKELIERWQRAHPEQSRVEGVRFTEFSSLARDAHRIGAESGLSARVKSVTARADQALLLGERAMFLAPRVPFIIRLQARVGVLEVLDDATARLMQLDPARALATVQAQLTRTAERLLWKAGAIGAGLIALFWAGYFLVVR
ncbi:MAG: hypothetical protein QM778_10300 [Myxococcales bacterium]